MENLTDRQKQLIISLLNSYDYVCNDISMNVEEVIRYTFMSKCYHILDSDYEQVCEIIDYIKEVNK